MPEQQDDSEPSDSDLSLALTAIETGGEKLGVRGLLLRDLVRAIHERKPRVEVDTSSSSWPAEAARAARRHLWPSRGRREEVKVEEDGLGVTVEVTGLCHHAPRCLRQLEEGFQLGCIRSLEFEAAINAIGRAQYTVVHRDLGPGRVCIFQLRPILSPRPSNLMDAPLLASKEEGATPPQG